MESGVEFGMKFGVEFGQRKRRPYILSLQQ